METKTKFGALSYTDTLFSRSMVVAFVGCSSKSRSQPDTHSNWSRNGYQTHVNDLNLNSTTSSAIISASQFLLLNAEVLSQCDKLDGVADNIILNVSLIGLAS